VPEAHATVDVVAAGVFGLVHREVGGFDEVGGLLEGDAGLVGGDADADGDGQRNGAAGHLAGGDGAANRLGQRGGDGAGGVGEDDAHFLTAVAGGHVVGTNGVFEEVAHVLQNGVAGRVAVAVVDALELVDVHHEQTERLAGLGAGLEFAGDGFFEAGAIVQAGELVGGGLDLELLVLLDELRLLLLHGERGFNQRFVGLFENVGVGGGGADVDLEERGDFAGFGADLLQQLIDLGFGQLEAFEGDLARHGDRAGGLGVAEHVGAAAGEADDLRLFAKRGVSERGVRRVVMIKHWLGQHGRKLPAFGEKSADLGVGRVENGFFCLDEVGVRQRGLVDFAVVGADHFVEHQHAHVAQQRR
jgi:hypothetical protein